MKDLTFKELIKSKHSYIFLIPLFVILILAGFFTPQCFEFFDYQPDAQNRILSNILTGFIAIPSTVLAISAILFAILQVSNRKITIIEMVFQNSYIIPLVYWSLINIILLVIIQLVSDTFSSYNIIRLLVCLSYNLIVLVAGLLFTLFRCFRYLDYTYITDDFIIDIYGQLNKEKKGNPTFDAQSLRQKSKEVYSEIADAIRKDDTIIVLKYLKSFAHTLTLNPSSNYITDFNKSLARWTLASMRGTSNVMFGAFIEFWRTHLTIKIEGKMTFAFSNIDRVPLLAYRMAEKDTSARTAIADAFALRLKEIAQKSVYMAMENEHLKTGASFENLISIYIEISELIKHVAQNGDLKTLLIVTNRVSQIRETFKLKHYRRNTNIIANNLARQQPVDTGFGQNEYANYLILKKAINDTNLIVIGNLYWLLFQQFNGNLQSAEFPHLKEVLTTLDTQIDYNESLQVIVDIFIREDERWGWEEWIWHGEERLDGKVYTVATALDMFGVGFAITLLKHPEINLSHHAVSDFQNLKYLLNRVKTNLQRVRLNPGAWPHFFDWDNESFLVRIDNVLANIDRVDENIENDFSQRLAATALSDTKVSAFRHLIAQQWEATRDLSKIFEHFGAVETNPETILKDTGPNIKMNKGRTMFVDGELYQFIYGIEWGKSVNRGVDSRFAEVIKEIAKESTETSLDKIFEKGIQELSTNGHKANLIIIDMGLFYANELALSATGRYSSSVNHNNPYPFEIAGFYDNEIPIVVLRSFDFNKLVAVVSLPQALLMQQRQEENNYNKNLKIEINEITLDQANQMIAERQEQDGENLSIHELMASMIVHIHQIFDFKIADKKAIKVYKSNLENFGN
ncbi:hypothetical protein GCM10027049_03670 [Mucilaginibacter puniceus]